MLSRAPKMDDALFSRLVESAKAKGFEVGRLIMTRQ